jgi:hypothetical protein
MLKDEIKKKQIESSRLTKQTRDSSYDIKITL